MAGENAEGFEKEMEDRHAPSPGIFYKGKTNNLAVRWMFDGLFREYGVDLVLQGHEHNYARMTNKNDEGEMTTPLYLVSHASRRVTVYLSMISMIVSGRTAVSTSIST